MRSPGRTAITSPARTCFDGNLRFDAVAHHARDARLQVHQAADGLRSVAARARFQHPPQQDEGDDGRGGFVIDLVPAAQRLRRANNRNAAPVPSEISVFIFAERWRSAFHAAR